MADEKGRGWQVRLILTLSWRDVTERQWHTCWRRHVDCSALWKRTEIRQRQIAEVGKDKSKAAIAWVDGTNDRERVRRGKNNDSKISFKTLPSKDAREHAAAEHMGVAWLCWQRAYA